jgi:hypothetical protein
MRDLLGLAFISSTIITLGCGGAAKPTAPDVDASGGGDTTPPTVVSISPQDMVTQVVDVPVVLTFSEAMDQASVEAVFPGATFTWNSDGTSVEIKIDFPFDMIPKTFPVNLPTTVTDLAGNGLAEPFASSFVLAELHSQTILHDPALSGNRAVGCAAGTFVLAGDQASTDPNCPSTITFGGVSFPLAGLPARAQILAVRHASVKTEVISVRGNPNAVGGKFIVDHVILASRNDLTAPVFKQENALTMFEEGTIVVGNPVALDVATLLDKSWTDNDANFQLRFHQVNVSNADVNDDMVLLRRAADENDGIVAPGLPEPDEANQMRLEIEFFQ